MQERHPIDELFRRGLNDAEATPPPAVWEGVVRRRHWGHRMLLKLERKWGWAVLLLLLIGTPMVWIAAQGGWTHIDPLRDSASAPVRTGTEAVTVVADNGTIHVPSLDPRTSTTDANNNATPPTSDVVRVVRERSNSTAGISHPLAGAPSSFEGEGGDAAMVIPSPEREVSMELALAAPRSVRFTEHRTPRPGAPLGSGENVSYVLGKGNWFFGVQAAVADVRGSWKGDGAAVETLNDAEEWQGQRSLGLIAGYRWNNGLSLGLGIEYAIRRSRFLYSAPGTATLAEVVDTTWSGTPAGPVTYYTWNIDTLLVAEPGPEQKLSATNEYGLLRIPIEISERWGARRWTMDVHAGAVMGLTIARDGRTLISRTIPGDTLTAAATVIEVVDATSSEVDDRFGFSLAGFLGADVGYRLSEQISAHAGPTYALDLFGGRDVRSRTSQLGAVLRIEYEFRARERVASPELR